MSDVGGLVRRGKDSIAVVEVRGKLDEKQWAELIERLRELAKKYPDLHVNVLGPKKP
jgi:hypothetical protein